VILCETIIDEQQRYERPHFFDFTFLSALFRSIAMARKGIAWGLMHQNEVIGTALGQFLLAYISGATSVKEMQLSNWMTKYDTRG